MKQNIQTTLVFLIIMVSFTSCYLGHSLASDNTYSSGSQILPEFTFFDMEGEAIRKETLGYGQSILFYYVDPKCTYCHDQTIWLQQNMPQLQDVQVLIISTRSKKYTDRFFERYKFDQYTNCKILYDRYKIFDEIFTCEGAPFMVLYDQYDNRIASFEGLTEMVYVNNAFSSLK